MIDENEQIEGTEQIPTGETPADKSSEKDGFDTVDEIALAASIAVTTPTQSESQEEEAASEHTAVPDIQDNAKLIDYGPNPHVTLTRGNPLGEKLKRPFDESQDYLDIPSIAVDEFGPVTATYKNYKLPQNEVTQRWQYAASRAPRMYLAGGAFDASLRQPDSSWKQTMQVGTEHIAPDRPKFTESTGNRLTGEEARLQIRKVLSAGSHVRIPLWHSGIWVTIKAPPESALLELDQRIANMKTELGKMSNGLVFASTSVYLVGSLIDFIFDHISETSYQGTLEETRAVILQPDYQQLVWGMLNAVYTDGYIYQQPCMVNPFKCTHVETARLNFGKMSFVNDGAFTDFQRSHMRRRMSGTQSKLDVQRYQSEHKFQKNAVVQLHDELAVELKVPTLTEYEESGRDWIDSITESVNNVFGKELDEDERNQQIRRYANLTILQQYSHWVRLISLTTLDKHIEDRESIQDVLSDLTSDDEVYKKFFEGIKAYMDGIMINIHGLPKYPCPACQEAPSEETLKHPMIFPIDLPEAFFTLVVQRIRRMLARQTS